MPVPLSLRAAFATLLVMGCRLEVRAPDTNPDETDRVEAVARGLYRAAADLDAPAWDTLASPAATLALAGTPARLVPARVLLGIPDVRGRGAIRVVRTEPRVDRGVAVVRVTVARATAGALPEDEAVDHVTLARFEGRWEVAHVVAGAWHRRGGVP